MKQTAGRSVVSPFPTGDESSASRFLIPTINVLFRHPRALLGIPLFLCLLVTVATLLAPRQYESTAAFIAQARQSPAGVAGLAAQLGITMGGGEGARSPEFYVRLLRSHYVLSRVAGASYEVPAGEKGLGRTTLTNLYGGNESRPGLRTEKAITELSKKISIDLDRKTNILTVGVASAMPTLSQQVAKELLAELDAFNLATRQSEARREREFVERRLSDAKLDLQSAEGRLQAFLERNREFRTSSILAFQEAQISRDVSLQQQIVSTLSQAYEQARIDEVRDTPVITVLEAPLVPLRPKPRHLLKRFIVAFIVGLLLAMVWAFWWEFIESVRSGDADSYREFVGRAAIVKSYFRRPWLLFRRPA